MIKDTIVNGFQNAPHRSLYHALGLTDEELQRPLIGVVCSYNEIVPGHKDLDKISFAQSSEVKTARYCIHSGLIASSKCSDSTRIGYYKKDYAPVCTGKHIAIAGDKESSSGASSGDSSTGSGETSSGNSSGAESGSDSSGSAESGGSTESSGGTGNTTSTSPPASSQAE